MSPNRSQEFLPADMIPSEDNPCRSQASSIKHVIVGFLMAEGRQAYTVCTSKPCKLTPDPWLTPRAPPGPSIVSSEPIPADCSRPGCCPSRSIAPTNAHYAAH
jgi:hypothetical protein